MALTIINSITDFSSYNSGSADIIMVRDADRTSGNHFIWVNSLSANGGTRYSGSSSGGIWQMMYEGPLNVKWFGALAATGTDAKTGIQAALDAAAATSDAVYLPDGTFEVSAPLRIEMA